MTIPKMRTSLHRYRWLIAILVVASMGYTVGKDRALRDNERAQAQSLNSEAD